MFDLPALQTPHDLLELDSLLKKDDYSPYLLPAAQLPQRANAIPRVTTPLYNTPAGAWPGLLRCMLKHTWIKISTSSMPKRKAVESGSKKRPRHEKPGLTAESINPFELRVNKRKHHVLGQRGARGERGMPGVSRAKAIEKVKQLK